VRRTFLLASAQAAAHRFHISIKVPAPTGMSASNVPISIGTRHQLTLAQNCFNCRPSPPPQTSNPAKTRLRYMLLLIPYWFVTES
jgi:hypothetical protein